MFNAMYQPQIKSVSTSTMVVAGPVSLNQIIVNSHLSGVIALYNGTLAILNTLHSSITLATGERWIPFNGEVFTDGLLIHVGGTAALTVQYRTNS